jgi:hypothetical protein
MALPGAERVRRESERSSSKRLYMSVRPEFVRTILYTKRWASLMGLSVPITRPTQNSARAR